MIRIADLGMVQASAKIPNPVSALDFGSQGKPASAECAIGRDIVVVPHRSGWPLDSDTTQCPGNVTHIISADDVVLVADAVLLRITIRKWQPRNFEPAGRKHERPRSNRRPSSAECRDLEMGHSSGGRIKRQLCGRGNFWIRVASAMGQVTPGAAFSGPRDDY